MRIFVRFLLSLLMPQLVFATVVQGRVTYQDGKPAQDFDIRMLPATPDATSVAHTRTDQTGHYELVGIKPGIYAIYAYNNSFQFPFRGDMFLTVNPDRVEVGKVQSVTFDLSLPKAAAVVNARMTRNGVPISKAVVILCHDEDLERSASVTTDEDRRFLYVVPSEEPLRLTIITNDKSFSIHLAKLQPDERRDIKFKTEETNTQNGVAPCKPFR